MTLPVSRGKDLKSEIQSYRTVCELGYEHIWALMRHEVEGQATDDTFVI